jgi:hypothetical protein
VSQWQRDHPDKARAIKKRWSVAHPEKTRAASKRYRLSHPDKERARSVVNAALRRARKRMAADGLTKEDLSRIAELYRQARLMKQLTGQQYHVDHKIALANGGKHHPDNLQLLTATENMRKGAKC